MTVTEYAEKILHVKLTAYQKEFIKNIEAGRKLPPSRILPKSVMHSGFKSTSSFIDETENLRKEGE